VSIGPPYSGLKGWNNRWGSRTRVLKVEPEKCFLAHQNPVLDPKSEHGSPKKSTGPRLESISQIDHPHLNAEKDPPLRGIAYFRQAPYLLAYFAGSGGQWAGASRCLPPPRQSARSPRNLSQELYPLSFDPEEAVERVPITPHSPRWKPRTAIVMHCGSQVRGAQNERELEAISTELLQVNNPNPSSTPLPLAPLTCHLHLGGLPQHLHVLQVNRYRCLCPSPPLNPHALQGSTSSPATRAPCPSSSSVPP
jgi:hypothetical protein